MFTLPEKKHKRVLIAGKALNGQVINISQAQVSASVMSDDTKFWALVRQALLLFVDAIERYKMQCKQRTAELRKIAKETK